MPHHCHALGCTISVPPTMLMCRRHWSQVPKNLQLAVYRHYRRGQCDDKQPSGDWLQAARAAIDHVKKLEGK